MPTTKGKIVGTSRKAVFLDRDGTLIREYAHHPDEVVVLPGVIEGLSRLADAGYLLVVVSNQGDVGRGVLPMEVALSIHSRFVETLARGGVNLTASYYCYHTPKEGCSCRKPNPGSLIRAAHALNLNMKGSWMVGDRPTDIECGHRARVHTYKVGPQVSFTDVVNHILGGKT